MEKKIFVIDWQNLLRINLALHENAVSPEVEK